MKLTSLLAITCCCCVATTGIAQKSQTSLSYRFATRAEAQMLVTDIDNYTTNWNQFDIESRLQKTNGKKSELLRLAMDETRNWSDTEKEKVKKVLNLLQNQITKQKFNLTFPEEIIIIKTTQKEEKSSKAYTRDNWIALGEQILSQNTDTLTQVITHELFHILSRENHAFKKAVFATIGFNVLDKNIIFPSDINLKRISNPNINSYDSYATFTINGQKQNCTMVLYSEKPYNGGQLTDYMQIGLIPLNEQNIPIQENNNTVIYPLTAASDFYDIVGQNTTYVIDPEEIAAENFRLAFLNIKEVKTPQIVEKIKEILKKNDN